MTDPGIHIEFLLTANKSSLQDFEMARLGHASKLKRRLAAVIDELILELVLADLARITLERQELQGRDLDAG